MAAADLVRGRIPPLALHIGHPALVAVGAALDDLGLLLLVAQRGQTLARTIAPGLLFLWHVNRSDAHLHLLILAGLAAAGCERVAVADGHDQADGKQHFSPPHCVYSKVVRFWRGDHY